MSVEQAEEFLRALTTVFNKPAVEWRAAMKEEDTSVVR
jgi:hypothetical protein